MPSSLNDILAEKQRELTRLQLELQCCSELPPPVSRNGIVAVSAGIVCVTAGCLTRAYLLWAGAVLLAAGCMMLITSVRRHHIALHDITLLNKRIAILQKQVADIEAFFAFLDEAPALQKKDN